MTGEANGTGRWGGDVEAARRLGEARRRRGADARTGARDQRRPARQIEPSILHTPSRPELPAPDKRQVAHRRTQRPANPGNARWACLLRDRFVGRRVAGLGREDVEVRPVLGQIAQRIRPPEDRER